MPYKAFISYSHAADGEFADSLHDAMEKLAKPWNRRRARQVVLDRTAMAAGASLGDTINEKLADSEWLVLLAAPESAQSKWCDDEIDYWKEHKSMDNVVVALTGGDIAVDPVAQRIDWENSPSLSPRYRAAVGDDAVPLFEDLRPFKQDLDHANLRNTHFRDEVAKIVGRIEGVDPGELASKEKREYAKTVRLRRAAEIGLLLLTVAAVFFGVQAESSRREAVKQENEAIAQATRADNEADNARKSEAEAIAERDRADEKAEEARREANRAMSSALASQAIAASSETPDLAALMALESVRIAPTVDAFISVVDSVVSATHFVWRTTVPGEPEPPIVGAGVWHDELDVALLGTEYGDVLVMTPDDPELNGASIGEGDIIGLAPVAGTSEVRTVDWDGWLTTVDLQSGEVTDVVDLGDILGGNISADASTIAFIGELGTDEYELIVIDADGEEIDFVEVIEPAEDCGACVALSPDGSTVAWVETDPVFFVDVVWTWNLQTGSFAEVFVTDGFVASLTFTPSGQNLVIGDDLGEGFLVPVGRGFVEDPDPLLVSDAEVLTYSFAQPEDGASQVMVTGHLNGSVRIWNFDESTESAGLVADLTRHNDEVRSVVVSADGGDVLSGGWDGDIISWRTIPRANHGVITPDAHQEEVMDVTFVGDDATVASAGFDGMIRLWDASSRGLLRETSAVDLAGDNQVVLFGLDADPTGERLAVGGTFFELDEQGEFLEDGVIEDFVAIIDLASEEVIETVTVPESPISVEFTPDGRYLAAGIVTGPVLVWETDDHGANPRVIDNAYAFTSGGVAFSGDSRLMAAGLIGEDGETFGEEIGVWDVATGELELTVPGNPVSTVTAVALNADGTILAWGDDTRLISLWHLPSNQQIGEDLTGHREPISDLEFADVDGDGVDALLASTSDDATTRVWEIRARRLVARIEAHRQDVTAVTISPEASLIVTSSEDQSLWVGDLNPETWVEAACELAGRNMSQEEWDALELTQDYVRHCGDYEAGDGAPPDAEIWTFVFAGVDTGEEPSADE